MQANILRYYFKIQAKIYKLWQLPKSKPSHQYRIRYKTTRKNAFDTAEVLKTFEIQQYIGFFVIAGLLELFTAYVIPTNIRPAMWDYQRDGNKF